MSKDDLTKHDLEKTLEAYAKTVELQILISQQQNKLLEQLEQCRSRLAEIEGHFTNGFRSELKEHTHQEVLVVKEMLDELVVKVDKQKETSIEQCNGCKEKLLTTLEEVQTTLSEVDRKSEKQMWIWGGIVLFTLANAVMMVIGMLT